MDQETKQMFELILKKLDEMGARFDGMDARFDGVDERLDGIDTRLDGMDARFDSVDARMDKFEAVQERLTSEMSAMRETLVKHTKALKLQDKHIRVAFDEIFGVSDRLDKVTELLEAKAGKQALKSNP